MSRSGFGRRISYITAGLVLALTAAVAGVDTNAVKDQPVIQVRLYNYARVPTADLQLAKRTAAQMFRRAGVVVRWSDLPVSEEEQRSYTGAGVHLGPANLSVRIVPEEQVPARAQNTHQVAFSLLPKSGSPGTLSSIYSDRIHDIARREGRPIGLVLGCVLAHEMGHLLLVMKGHSGNGLMSFPITGKYLSQASSGRLDFSAAQTERLQHEVWKRIRSEAGAMLAGRAQAPRGSPE